MSLPKHCEDCPLNDQPCVTPSKAPYGSPAVVGSAPNQLEVVEGTLFVGGLGQILRAAIQGAGNSPDHVYLTTACLCRPPHKEDPPDEAIESCRPRLKEELETLSPSAILLCGNNAVKAFFPDAPGIMKFRGQAIWSDEYECYIVPTVHPGAVLNSPGLFKDLYEDIELWTHLQGKEKVIEPPEDLFYYFIETTKGLKSMIKRVEEVKEGFVDLETTGIDPLHDRIISIGVSCNETEIWIIPEATFRKKSNLKLLKEFFEDKSIWWAGHNGPQFDSRFLRADLDINWVPDFDSLLGHYALDERQGTHSLKKLAAKYALAPDYAIDFNKFDHTDPEQMEALYWYHALDMRYTAIVANEVFEELELTGKLMGVHDEILLPASLALGRVEDRGVKIDVPYLEGVGEDLDKEIAELLAQAQSESGKDDFNPNSPKQVKEILHGKFGVIGANSSTGKAVLVDAAKICPLAQTILDYRLKSKLKSTYVKGILSKVDENDRIHADFLLFGTETGRLSARSPNLQNIPQLVGPLVRRAFISQDGWLLSEVDYSQLELRIAAYYSNDEFLLQGYRDGLDIHTLVASEVLGKPMEDITYEERYQAKWVDFGIIYGRGAYSLATQQLHCPVEEAQSFIDRFLARFSGLHTWIQSQHQFAAEHGYVETPFGRRRRFPLILNDNLGDIQRQSVNTPVQSLASDVCLTALARLDPQLDPKDARIVSTVHDSILFEIRQGAFHKVLPLIRYEMEENCPIDITSRVKLDCDISIGKNWGDAKDHSWEETIEIGDAK
jgi:DNA polymerase-1